MGISVGVMREGLEIWWLSMKTERETILASVAMGEGAHSSCYLIIIASSKAWSFQLLKVSHAGLKCHEAGVLR